MDPQGFYTCRVQNFPSGIFRDISLWQIGPFSVDSVFFSSHLLAADSSFTHCLYIVLGNLLLN